MKNLHSRGGWQISGAPLDLHDPRLLAIAEAERQLLEAEYDDYSSTNASGAAFCRSAALIVSIYQHILFHYKFYSRANSAIGNPVGYLVI